MLSVKLSQNLENRLNHLAAQTNRTKSFYVSQALQNFLDDKEDYLLALEVLEGIKNGDRTYTLEEIEKETGKKVQTILQLRLHPSIIALKKRIEESPENKIHDIDLTYITSRGHWYHMSWKGDVYKSGGIATNIGIHFFDMLSWVFGGIKKNTVHLLKEDCAAGFLELEKARVRWFLSINVEHLPEGAKSKGKRTYRSLTMEGKEIEFSEGFTDLHTTSYKHILEGKGFGLKEARPSIQTVYEIRNQTPAVLQGDYHPFAKDK